MTLNRKTFVFKRHDDEEPGTGGFKPTAILVQHYNDEGFRTVLLDEEEFKHLAPWRLCALLNDAYESGYKDAKADIRDMLGVK
jgi:hypothetical protein